MRRYAALLRIGGDFRCSVANYKRVANARGGLFPTSFHEILFDRLHLCARGERKERIKWKQKVAGQILGIAHDCVRRAFMGQAAAGR